MKTTNKYFDAPSMIAQYEADTGNVVSEDSKKLVVVFEPVINKAYREGFVAGLKAARYSENMGPNNTEEENI